MELQLLAEIANDIFGTGQVFCAGGNLTPLNGTAGREERVWPGQTCWCFTGSHWMHLCTCTDLFESWTLSFFFYVCLVLLLENMQDLCSHLMKQRWRSSFKEFINQPHAS